MSTNSKMDLLSHSGDPQLFIYARYSTDMQSTKSCEDQEREVRDALTRMGIDHSEAEVIHDEAQSGTKTNRDGFARLENLIQSGKPVMLVVDDQARLSRTDNTFGFITDLVYAGGRFLSTGEGIDTEQTGWELRVKVMELHNSTSIRELGRRVRRGQLGRVLANRSSGDFCYGYESYIVNLDGTATVRGPKPEKAIRIKRQEADWVKQIFEWFIACRSIAWIADQLNQQNAPRGNRQKKNRWQHYNVRKILGNDKYIGLWRWGTTRTMRNSQGKKKQVPTPKEQHIVVERPELRIIDQDVWDLAQRRLELLHSQYGVKPGDQRRGPKVHHTELYPNDLLSGLVYCSSCGSRMWKKENRKRLYLFCPNKGKSKHSCNMVTSVPAKVAEEKLLKAIESKLTSSNEWIHEVISSTYKQVEELGNTLPAKIETWKKQFEDVKREIDNLVDALAESSQSQALHSRLKVAESKAESLRQLIDGAIAQLDVQSEMPDEAWIQKQLTNLSGILAEGGFDANVLLRQLIKRIEADQVIAPGKSRGYSRLRVRFDPSIVLSKMFKSSAIQHSIRSVLDEVEISDDMLECVIDLGKLTKMDQWAPEIARLRREGKKWTDIVEITGMDLNRVFVAWKRYLRATNDDVIEDQASSGSEASSAGGDAA